MTVVIGTAGHIDHGKTTLLRALTGIDADRLPEERSRRMTIDVGYARLDLDDGTTLDFVDVPGHDRYVGNMLVGAGEIDAAMLVVAADDGPRPQTIEHLELLDALEIRDGLAVVTKSDAVPADRAAEVAALVGDLLERTTLGGSPVLVASGTTGIGIPEVRAALRALRDRAVTRGEVRPVGPLRLAIDRAFAVKGRGAVVTGSLRGGSIAVGGRFRLVPGGSVVRVRGIEVHNAAASSHDAGRTALNLAGVEGAELRRGQVLTRGSGIEVSNRLLVRLGRIADLGEVKRDQWPPPDGTTLRLHIGTDQVDAVVRRPGRGPVQLGEDGVAAELSLSAAVATFVGDRAVLRRPSPGRPAAAVLVLDPAPPRGVGRRRVTPERVVALAAAIHDGDADAAADAVVGLHGALWRGRVLAVEAALRAPGQPDASTGVERAELGGLVLAADVAAAMEAHVLDLVAGTDTGPGGLAGVALAELRAAAERALRRLVTLDRASAEAAADALDTIVDDLVARGRLAREGDRVRAAGREPAIGADLAAAMDRLEAALAVAAPPPLADAARAAGCSTDGIRALLAAGRITRVERDLAWATPTYHGLARLALDLATPGPLTPAAFRDATGTSRRFVLAILEDLDRREILKRTPDGHVPGPRAPSRVAESSPSAIPSVTAIVLAGGRSSRFGSEKLAASLEGRPLLDHVIDAVRQIADEVVLALPAGGDPPAALEAPHGVRIVRDPEPFGGPLVGLSAALEVLTTPVAIVVAGDMPWLRPAVLGAMLAALQDPAGRTGPAPAAVVLDAAGGAQPLPLAIRVEPARTAAEAAIDAGDRSLRLLLDRLTIRALPETEWRPLDPDGETLLDVDRPADLERLARRHVARSR